MRIPERGDAEHGRRSASARDDLRSEIPPRADHRRPQRRRPGDGEGSPSRRPAPRSCLSASPSLEAVSRRGRACARSSGVEIVPLDVTDTNPSPSWPSRIGGIDIIVNTAEHVRAGGVVDRHGPTVAREEMDIRYLGLMRLAQAFGPVLRSRGADGVNSARRLRQSPLRPCADELAGLRRLFGGRGGVPVAAQCMRAELRPGGVKVLNVFFGPLETEWFQTVPPPKVAPRALASASCRRCEAGIEDVFVGDVAEDIRAAPRGQSRRRSSASWRIGSRTAWTAIDLLAFRRRDRVRRGPRRRSDAYAGPDFPTIVLPPEFGQCAPFRIEEVSRYDERGPAWYWNNISSASTPARISMRRSTGSPARTCRTTRSTPSDVRKFIAPACVIDCSAEAAPDPDFVLTIPFVEAWESAARPDRGGQLGAAAHRLVEERAGATTPTCATTARTRRGRSPPW